MLKKYFSPSVIFCFLLFLGLPVCVSYQLLDPFVAPRVILVAATVLIVLLVLFFQKEKIDVDFITTENRSPVLFLLLFLLLYALSIFKSLNPGDAWYEWMKSFAGFSILVLTAQLFRNEESRKTVLKFSQVSILILSSVYAYQWIYYFNHQDFEKVFDLKLHIASTLGNKNFYAEIMCLLFPFSVISFFSLPKKWKLLCVFNAFVLIGSLVLTQSYAALLAFLAASLIASMVFYFTNPARTVSGWKVTGIVAAALLILCVGVFKSGMVKSLNQRVETIHQYIANPEQIDSTTKANSNSTFERILLWRNSVKLIKEHPLSGCGMNNWKLLYPKFGVGGTRYIEEGNVHYEHPHNDYLLIASEAGIPALLAYLAFLISMSCISIREMKRNANGRLWFAGILVAVISFSIVSIFSFPRMRFYGWIVLAIYSGILLSFSSTEKKESSNQITLIGKIIMLLIAGISLWTFTAGIIRYNSEVHSKGVQLAKKQTNFARVVREAEKASSFYFPVDETATPFSWYKGMALFYSGNIQQSRIEYEDALTKNPYHIQLLNDLATSCEQSNERERAVELYQRALSVTPYFPHSLLNISACYFNMGKKDSAFIYIDKIYGIRLGGQEKRSYDVFLPAILHSEVKKESEFFQEDKKIKLIEKAQDEKWLMLVYMQSKKQNVPFMTILEDSLSTTEK